MKCVRVLLYLGAACLAVAGPAWGQARTQATIRLSWNTCDPQNVDMLATDPITYTLVVSAADFVPGEMADDHLGTEVWLSIAPATGSGFPDAWRFDDLGCQTGAQLSAISSGIGKACPGINPGSGWGSIYAFDSATNQATLWLFRSYFVPFSPQSGVRYVLWQVGFDMSYAVVGSGEAGMTCGDLERPVRISLEDAWLGTLHGEYAYFQTAPGDRDYATWNMGPPVAAVAATWGRLKGLYR